MTALTNTQTAPATPPAHRPYPLDQVRKRGGYYVARLEGPDPKYGVKREFLTGRPVKTRNVIEYRPADLGTLPAWVLVRPDEACPTCCQTRPTKDTGEDVVAAFESGWTHYGRIFGTVDLLTIWNAGTPGTPGAWTGDRCTECNVTPTFAPETLCESCTQAAANRKVLAALPDADTF